MEHWERLRKARKMVQIRLDSKLWQRAKVAAALADRTLQEWVEEAIADKLNK